MARGIKTPHDSSAHFSSTILEMSDILSILGNLHRLGILMILRRGPQGFRTLLEETGLKKSSLANQLRLLRGGGLIEKVSHGTYTITDEGNNYLEALEGAYREGAEKRKRAEEARQREEIVRAFLERK
jgi:DNA-binding HxlR family transcriptional regulator